MYPLVGRNFSKLIRMKFMCLKKEKKRNINKDIPIERAAHYLLMMEFIFINYEPWYFFSSFLGCLRNWLTVIPCICSIEPSTKCPIDPITQRKFCYSLVMIFIFYKKSYDFLFLFLEKLNYWITIHLFGCTLFIGIAIPSLTKRGIPIPFLWE
jgi:hypothetical protein